MNQSLDQQVYGMWQNDLVQSPSTCNVNYYSTPSYYNTLSYDSGFYNSFNSSPNHYSYGYLNNSPSSYTTYDSSSYSSNDASYNTYQPYYSNYDYYANCSNQQPSHNLNDNVCSTPVSIDSKSRLRPVQELSSQNVSSRKGQNTQQNARQKVSGLNQFSLRYTKNNIQFNFRSRIEMKRLV